MRCSNDYPKACQAFFFPLTNTLQVFFSYIGFDSVTTLSEEVRNPRKDIPFGVIVTLTIAAVLYIAIALVITGMQPWLRTSGSTRWRTTQWS